MVKFAKKHFLDDEANTWINSYNYHPYTSYCSPEFMVKKLGWIKCKEIVLDCMPKGYTSKVIYYVNNYQYEFFCIDLQHLLSFYYEDIPKYYE